VKVSHAAALALVGWYLMVPPTGCNGRPNNRAPLSSWTILMSFDHSDGDGGCSPVRLGFKGFKVNGQQMDEKTLASLLKDFGYIGPVKAAESAQCIASDDPRLKEK
jgi:hypothetical protein